MNPNNVYAGHSSEIVPTANLRVCRKERRVLTAYLGTCVGVILLDPVNQVSGLYHILLGRSNSGSPISNELLYAESGLPLFVGEMLKNGADRENLQAVIAGGGFVGHATVNDFSLNIGGQTADHVHRFLEKEQISIIYSETGGYFNCSLTLNCFDQSFQVEPIGREFAELSVKPETLTKDEILHQIQRIKPIPQVALKIIDMINTEKVSLKQIAAEIRQEQVLAARVLNLCNSSFYSPGYPIDSIDRGIVLLGERRIMLLALSIITEMYFGHQSAGYSMVKGGMFIHAFQMAVTSEKIASMSGQVSRETAYTAGLLHDIGKVVLDQHMVKNQTYFYRNVYNGNKTLLEAEDELFGTTHVSTGKLLAESWHLPESLRDVIAYHHTPQLARHTPELTYIIYIADLIISRFQVGLEFDRISATPLTRALDVLGLGRDSLPEIIEFIPQNPEKFFQNSRESNS